MKTNLLNVNGLEVRFDTREGELHAVNGVSFQVGEGETLGIVGESGCGKSVTMMSILRLVPSPPGKIVSGQAYYRGIDLFSLSGDEMRRIRGSEIALIFQDPMTSLNPVLPIGFQVAEPLITHKGMSKEEALEQAAHMLSLVGIPNARERLNNYPHQFSGGMRQRVMIAMALICSPKVLIADEPTTALDVTIQAQIVDLVKHLRNTFGMSVIWITHDLGVVAGLVDRVVVMYAGFIVEEAAVDEFYENPQHPYSIGLLTSLPRLDAEQRQRLASIEGLPPILMQKPDYCPFLDRCRYAHQVCKRANPQLYEIAPGHKVACWVNPATGKERL